MLLKPAVLARAVFPMMKCPVVQNANANPHEHRTPAGQAGWGKDGRSCRRAVSCAGAV